MATDEQRNESGPLDKPKIRTVELIIPDCCRELWDSCPHTIPLLKKKKYNVI